ncbi:hypothetical protein C8R44DRAFT_734003 [Mycena epipterygia]|nr:hypothetical protein C8R44DRAFT_734003 [Mycena epipterygia]
MTSLNMRHLVPAASGFWAISHQDGYKWMNSRSGWWFRVVEGKAVRHDYDSGASRAPHASQMGYSGEAYSMWREEQDQDEEVQGNSYFIAYLDRQRTRKKAEVPQKNSEKGDRHRMGREGPYRDASARTSTTRIDMAFDRARQGARVERMARGDRVARRPPTAPRTSASSTSARSSRTRTPSQVSCLPFRSPPVPVPPSPLYMTPPTATKSPLRPPLRRLAAWQFKEDVPNLDAHCPTPTLRTRPPLPAYPALYGLRVAAHLTSTAVAATTPQTRDVLPYAQTTRYVPTIPVLVIPVPVPNVAPPRTARAHLPRRVRITAGYNGGAGDKNEMGAGPGARDVSLADPASAEQRPPWPGMRPSPAHCGLVYCGGWSVCAERELGVEWGFTRRPRPPRVECAVFWCTSADEVCAPAQRDAGADEESPESGGEGLRAPRRWLQTRAADPRWSGRAAAQPAKLHSPRVRAESTQRELVCEQLLWAARNSRAVNSARKRDAGRCRAGFEWDDKCRAPGLRSCARGLARKHALLDRAGRHAKLSRANGLEVALRRRRGLCLVDPNRLRLFPLRGRVRKSAMKELMEYRLTKSKKCRV